MKSGVIHACTYSRSPCCNWGSFWNPTKSQLAVSSITRQEQETAAGKEEEGAGGEEETFNLHLGESSLRILIDSIKSAENRDTVNTRTGLEKGREKPSKAKHSFILWSPLCHAIQKTEVCPRAILGVMLCGLQFWYAISEASQDISWESRIMAYDRNTCSITEVQIWGTIQYNIPNCQFNCLFLPIKETQESRAFTCCFFFKLLNRFATYKWKTT